MSTKARRKRSPNVFSASSPKASDSAISALPDNQVEDLLRIAATPSEQRELRELLNVVSQSAAAVTQGAQPPKQEARKEKEWWQEILTVLAGSAPLLLGAALL